MEPSGKGKSQEPADKSEGGKEGADEDSGDDLDLEMEAYMRELADEDKEAEHA